MASTDMSDALLWNRLRVVLGKWSREEPLSLEDQRVMVEAQNEDVNRYRAMRLEARDYVLRCGGCF